MALQHKQIGEVAERTGLSLRTIRYYEEVGLIRPSARSHGGFRLYTELDIARLELVMRMKPLDFSLDEMRSLLEVLDALEETGGPSTDRDELLERLGSFQRSADERCESLRTELDLAEGFAEKLRREVVRQRRAVSRTR